MLILGMPLWRQALRGLGAIICNWIYGLISFLFQVFVTVAQANIFDENTLGPIYQRITLILTIVMTFYITFEFVKYIIQPDTMGDKEKGIGNIGLKIIIVIVLIAMVPRIFSLAYSLQGRILNQNVIGKVILGSAKQDYNKIGNEFAADMLETFYYPEEESNIGTGTREQYEENMSDIRTKGKVNILPSITSPDTPSGGSMPYIHFDGLMAIVVGGLIVYILILYSIDLGLRYAQLLYLQVMAPIAIMGYLLPKKDGIFQKWTKQCLTTYLDVFIRLSLMYFALLLINLIGKNRGDLFAGIPGTNGTVETFAYIAIILGLLLFVQKAPKLLQDLLGQSSVAGIGMGLGAKSRFEPTIKAVKRTGNIIGTGRRVAGALGGFAAGTAVGKGFGGRLRAGAAGAKTGFDKNRKGLLNGSVYKRVQQAKFAGEKKREEEEEIVANAPVGTSRGRALNQSLYKQEHWANVAKEQDRQLKHYDVPKATMDALTSQIDEMKQIKVLKLAVKAAENRGAPAEEIKTLDARYKAACQTVRQQVVKNGGNLETILQDQKNGKFLKFTYDELDANGFAKYETDSTGAVVYENGKPKKIQHEVTFQFDSGDQNFASPTYTIAHSEYEKAMSSDVLKNIEVEINGSKKKIGSLTEEEYITYIHKIKDAMAAPKTEFENSHEFEEAHAFAKGGETSGKK